MPTTDSKGDLNRLLLHEEITLLALRNREGTFQINMEYDCAVGGAIAAELLLNGRIGVENGGRKKLAKLISTESLSDPLLDECMEKVRLAKRRASLERWVSRFSTVRHLRRRLGEQLCRRGILRAEEDKVLWLFKRQVYPEVNPLPEKRLIERITLAITSNSPDLDPRTAVIISLAKSANLLRFVLDKPTLYRRKKRIERIVSGDAVGKATREAIEAVQTALVVACVIPAFTATSACG